MHLLHGLRILYYSILRFAFQTCLIMNHKNHSFVQNITKYQIRQKSPHLDDWQIKLCNILEILFLFRHPCNSTNQDAEFLKLLPLQSDFERLKEIISLRNGFCLGITWQHIMTDSSLLSVFVSLTASVYIHTEINNVCTQSLSYIVYNYLRHVRTRNWSNWHPDT